MENEGLFQRVALVFVVLIYIAARFLDLTASCLWFDEIFSIHAAEHPWNLILAFIALDLIHPPLFYVMLKLWISIGGDSLFWLRLFPVGLSVIAVFPFIAFCRELKLGKWTQILALLLFAVNGSMIKYAQEVRMYSLLLCLSLFSMWLFARYFVKGKSFVPLVLANILLVYTHYFGWFVIIAEVAAILVYQPIKWRRAVAMFVAAAAGFLPWMIAVGQASSGGSGLSQNIGWMSRPGIRVVGTLIVSLVEPFYFQASSAEPVSVLRVTVPLLLIVVAAAGIFAANRSTWNESDRRDLRLLLLFIVIPVSIAFVASWTLPYSVWGTRHLTIIFPPIFVLLAIIFTSRLPSWLPAAAVTLIVLFAGYGFALRLLKETPQYSWCAWEPLAASAMEGKSEPIYVFEDLVAYQIWFAGRKDETAAVVRITGIEGIREDTAFFLPRGFDAVKKMDLAEVTAPNIWLALRGETISESEPPLRNFLLKDYRIADRKEMTAGSETAVFMRLEK